MSARFKLNENLLGDAKALLADAGVDVESVIDERLGGYPDDDVLNACRVEGRILITLDLDFADLRLYPPAAHAGIWVLRPATQSVRNTLSDLKGALALIGEETTAARLWIVEPGRVRIRE
ncbi:MAG: DUF5615 family PIN-like protein [Betaproteobacteria bacterium]